MKNILHELRTDNNVRANLSAMRQKLKESPQYCDEVHWAASDIQLLISYLQSEDAKTRKNAALLLGDIRCQTALEILFQSYQAENTLFVKGSYLSALSNLDVSSIMPQLRERMQELCELSVEDDSRKHVDEEMRILRKILIKNDGIEYHTFSFPKKEQEIILTTNRLHREILRRTLSMQNTKIHPLGVCVKTNKWEELQKIRIYREALFPIHAKGFLSENPIVAAQELWDSDLYTLLQELHKENGPFYFRIECRSSMTLEERSVFSKRLSVELERLSGAQLVNSATDYEVEIRLIASREGGFFPSLKCYTWKDDRFSYRKNSIAASIHPQTAALIMELSRPYLKENAQIIDPFCGVGTMLIERDKCVSAKEFYATDIFGEAIEKARENAACANKIIHFIHRDFFDFTHDYFFDEIITNMPLRGKRTKAEMDMLYEKFFAKALEILAKDAVIIMYTNEIGFVKKQLRIHKEYRLLQETCMQQKTGFYLLILGVAR